MESMPAGIEIRATRESDQAAIIEICHQTGDRRIDPYLFGLRWCLDYLWHESENCFVAVDTQDQQVVGYILGALDTAAQAERLKEIMVPRAVEHWREMEKRSFHDWRFLMFMRWIDRQIFTGLYRQYPAHLHINLAEKARRRGIGARLLAAYENNLREKGVSGYHLGVGAENQVGIGFYRKMGLEQLAVFPRIGKAQVVAFGRILEKNQPVDLPLQF
jgi:ribosomal protein S18 acetylase RimI-like enzyme